MASPSLGRHIKAFSYSFPRNLIWRDVGPPLNLFELGFTYIEAKTRYTVPYDEVWWIKAHVVIYKLYGLLESGGEQRYEIGTESRTIKLDERIVNVGEAYSEISGQVIERLLPRYLGAFARGEPVSFGKFVLAADHLQFDGKSITWDELDYIQLDNGHLRIHMPKKGKDPTGTPHREAWIYDPTSWAYIPLDEITNAPILLELIDRKVGLEVKGKG